MPHLRISWKKVTIYDIPFQKENTSVLKFICKRAKMALNRSPEIKGSHFSNFMCCRNSVWVCMGFNQYNLGQHLPCQISCIRGKWFWRFQYGSNPGHPEAPFWTLGSQFEKTRLRIKRQCYMPNFKQLRLEKKIFKHILLKNHGSPWTKG